MNLQRGTINEWLAVAALLGVPFLFSVLLGVNLFVLAHFIIKYW